MLRLEYGHRGEKLGRDLQHDVQVGAAISHNAALTSPHYSIQGQPSVEFKLACLTDAGTGEQSLSVDTWYGSARWSNLPIDEYMLRDTHLQLGHGLNVGDVQEAQGHAQFEMASAGSMHRLRTEHGIQATWQA
jgi:hypothetical protein